MPLREYTSRTKLTRKLNTSSIYDALDKVRESPGIYLNTVDDSTLTATKMDRLQAFISALECFADLNDGDPPFSLFMPWAVARVEWIKNTFNGGIHAFDSLPGTEAFELYFNLLDEYRRTEIVEMRRVDVPFGGNYGPTGIIIGQFSPSPVYFWSELGTTYTLPISPFCSSLRKAMYGAKQRYGIAFQDKTK